MILQRVSNDADRRMGPWGQFTWQTNVSLGRKQRHTAYGIHGSHEFIKVP